LYHPFSPDPYDTAAGSATATTTTSTAASIRQLLRVERGEEKVMQKGETLPVLDPFKIDSLDQSPVGT
jgi:hypothetical protein